MNKSQTLIESLGTLAEVTTQGDIRRIVANSLLALARKEISGADVEAMAKGLDSISNSLKAEIAVARTAIELREKGGQLGTVVQLGSMLIGNNGPQGS